jgi:predicted RNA-binding protein with EMAP domain
MKIEVANGEIIDKHTILVIKSERITDAEKLAFVKREMEALSVGVKYVYNSVDDASTVHDLAEKLKKINEQLWDVEDELRVLESKADFGQEFINKARSVYFLNDERAALKKAVNVLTGSTIVEAKSYIDYTVRGTDSQE